MSIFFNELLSQCVCFFPEGDFLVYRNVNLDSHFVHMKYGFRFPREGEEKVNVRDTVSELEATELSERP